MFNLTKAPSTNPDRLSVPVIDTASYTEAQLNAMPSELARRGRVSRLAAAMRSLHEETMRNYDAGVMDEQQQILHQEQQQQQGGGGVQEFNFGDDPSSLTSASPQQQLKFHAVGWKPKQQQQTSVSRLRNRTSGGGAGVSSPSPATTFSRSRVVSQNDTHNNNISFHGNDDQNDSSSKIRNTNNSPIKTGTWASASRQRHEMQRIMLKQDVQKKKNDLVISQQRKGNRTMMAMTNQKKNNEGEDQEPDDDANDTSDDDDETKNNSKSKKKKKSQGQEVEEFPGETEGEKFRNASVALRNINLKLKVMYEKRYRARIDDTNDGTENDPEEKRRRREAQSIVRREEAMEKKKQKRRQDLEANGYSKSEIEQLEKEGKLFGGLEMMNDTSVDEADVEGDVEGGGGAAIGNAKMSMLLEQKEREATEATRQWKQSALDAELLSSELLRAQATIERYKLFMDETTQENERLRSEVETLKRELLMSKNRTQRIIEDNQLRDDSLSRYGSLAVSKRGSLRNTTMSNAGSFASIGQKVISFTSNTNFQNNNNRGSPSSPSPQQPLDDNDVPVPVAAVKTTTTTEHINRRNNNNDDDLIPQIMTPTDQDISVPTPERGGGDDDHQQHATTGDFVVANLGDGNKTDTKKETARGV